MCSLTRSSLLVSRFSARAAIRLSSNIILRTRYQSFRGQIDRRLLTSQSLSTVLVGQMRIWQPNYLPRYLTTSAGMGYTAEGAGSPMNESPSRRLLLRAEALSYLQLEDEQLQTLINTRQITPIRIAGVERFDRNDLDELINTYKTTASRRP